MIPLTRGKFVLVDDDDFEWLSKVKWHYTSCGYAARAVRLSKNKTILIRMHRNILIPPKEAQIDHINGNGLDNRKSNLRICDKTQNQGNRRKIKKAKSKYKGVALNKGKWVSYIKDGPKIRHLGRFIREEDAALAYNFAALGYFGEFARMNT